MRVRFKALLCFTASLIFAGILSGCSSSLNIEAMREKTPVSHGTLQVSEIAETLVENTATSVSLVCLDSASIPSYYSFNPELVEDAAVYISANSSYSEEIAVFEMAEGKDETEVLTAVNNRMLSKTRAFRDINPTEYDKLRNAVQVNISGYIVLAVTAHPEMAQSVITELFYGPVTTMATVKEE